MTYSNGYKVNETPSAITITNLDNGAYTLKDSKGYLYPYGSNSLHYYSSSSSGTFYYWSITYSDNSYLIQCSELNTSYYNSEQYLGWPGENATAVYYNQPITGAVHWQLVPADADGDRYAAALMLYKELKNAEVLIQAGYNAGVIDYYTNLYAARETADVAEMIEAALKLRRSLGMSQGYIAPYWSEKPILWTCSEGTFGDSDYYTWALPSSNYTSGTFFYRQLSGIASSSISATVIVDEPSAFIYSLSGSNGNIKVYVDDQLVRDLTDEQYQIYTYGIHARFVENLTAGKHTIKWVVNKTSSSYNGYYNIYTAGVMASPLITVSLLEPGSLGTEVLYNTDHIKNVRRLKIKGTMNSDDWSKIKMMHYLQDLDLSEAVITEIPANQFSVNADSSSNFLHRLILPEGLKTINDGAFYYSLIDNLVFPSTVTTVGQGAFACSHIQKLDLPDNMTEIGDYNSRYGGAFSGMYWLKSLKLPKNLTYIPKEAFNSCYYLTDVVLPESLETIYGSAFYDSYNIKIASFPEKLTSIGSSAFYNCRNALATPLNDNLQTIGDYAFYGNSGTEVKTVVIPNSVTSIGSYAFQGCTNLESITLSEPVWKLSNNILSNCSSLKALRLNCPTVAKYNTNSSYYPVDVSQISQVDLYVPEIVVTSYKLDNYWYNCQSINGFSTEEIQDWTINNPLVLNRERFAGEPNITISADYDRLPSLKINGDNEQVINDLCMDSYLKNYENYPGQILSNCSNVTINGAAKVNLGTAEKRWYFFSLPYDMKVSDIVSTNTGGKVVQKAVRYYDGANRATVGGTGSWKNFEADAVIPAGTGFIMQTNYAAWNLCPSFNETKQNIVATTEFVKTLEVNDSETASNKGWNLVGNPWQCFFNNHYLNFTGPITVWDTYNKTYVAYSIIDDDYAIRPNEAFFVQCPDAEHNTIGFPKEGRQLTAEIVNQNPVQAAEFARAAQMDARRLVDVVISDGEHQDQTRIVLNEGASMDYDLTCDASKMMSMDASVPQIFSLGNEGTQYSINERPVGDGFVNLGFFAGKAGEYTFKLSRSMVEAVILVDHMTGNETDLANSEYTFTTEAGTDDARFSLKFNPAETTGIKTVQSETSDDIMYNINGQRISKPVKGIMIRGGKKVFIK
ncbi:MAG: leucine-rich repeat domain-containing protein [Prevotella sp.]